MAFDSMESALQTTLRANNIQADGKLSSDAGKVTTNGAGLLTVTAVVLSPGVDPHVLGALWNNNGTLTISAG